MSWNLQWSQREVEVGGVGVSGAGSWARSAARSPNMYLAHVCSALRPWPFLFRLAEGIRSGGPMYRHMRDPFRLMIVVSRPLGPHCILCVCRSGCQPHV
jgi:hypothetical protein